MPCLNRFKICGHHDTIQRVQHDVKVLRHEHSGTQFKSEHSPRVFKLLGKDIAKLRIIKELKPPVCRARQISPILRRLLPLQSLTNGLLGHGLKVSGACILCHGFGSANP